MSPLLKPLGQLVRDSEDVSEAVQDAISAILEEPGMLNAVLAAIPDKWQYSEMRMGGDCPTKHVIAWWYLWELVVGRVPIPDSAT